MSDSKEILNHDSTVIKNSATEKIVKKTDTQLWKVFEDEMKKSSPDFIIEEVRKLNPEVRIEADADRWLLFWHIYLKQLLNLWEYGPVFIVVRTKSADP